MTEAKSRVNTFFHDEGGSMTVLAVFLTIAILLAAGLAIDVNNAVQSEVQLQGTADAAGHAGIVELFKNGNTGEVTKQAIQVAELNMPKSVFKEVLASTDVEVGSWNSGSRTFSVGAGADAVRVVTRRLDNRGNALATFLLRLVGQDTLQMNTQSVWAFGGGLCPNGNQGFFAMGEIDMQSGNTFSDEFCLHGELGVKVSTDNDVTHAYVTMPNYSDLTGPTSAGAQKLDPNSFDTLDEYFDAVKAEYEKLYEKNPGLKFSHGTYDYESEMLDYFKASGEAMKALYDSPSTSSPLIPDTLIFDTETSVVVTHNVSSESEFSNVVSIAEGSLVKNKINKITCSHENGGNSSAITFATDAVITDLVIVTNCDVIFGNGSSFAHGAVVTTSTSGVTDSGRAIEGPSGSRFGDTGYCDAAAGKEMETVVASAGSVHFASGFETHGVNMVVLGDVDNIAANPDGGGGINLYVNGDIDITSNGTFGFCGKSPDDLFDLRYIRMVM
ncbi:TadE/TadG family type IV pilus assembly protein [Actibacterium pelagium]|nr:TadE/TadG family type IV pilus assembly protein [Actibacterium pelagium]